MNDENGIKPLMASIQDSNIQGGCFNEKTLLVNGHYTVAGFNACGMQ